MTNSRANQVELLHSFNEEDTTGTTETYTPANPLNLFTKYLKIIIEISGTPTAALAIQMKINAVTNYDNTYILMDTSTLSGAIVDAASTWELIPAALVDTASIHFNAKAELTSLEDSADSKQCEITSTGYAVHEGQVHTMGSVQATVATITSIELLVSTSSWKKNTNIRIWGILR